MKKYILLISMINLIGCSEKGDTLTGWELEFSDHCVSIIDDYYDVVGESIKVTERVRFLSQHDIYFECRKTFRSELARESIFKTASEIRDEYDECVTKVDEKHKKNPVEYPNDQGPVVHTTGVKIKGRDEAGKIVALDLVCDLNHPDGSIAPDNFDEIEIETFNFDL